MKRLMIVVAASLAVSLSLQGQMRGGMGGRGSGSMGRGAGVAVRGTPAMPAGRFGTVSSTRFAANSGRFSVRPHSRFFFRRRCFDGFGCRDRFFFGAGLGSPFGLGYYPYGYYPGDYNQQPSQPVVVSNDEGGSTALAVEVQRLSDEIEFMREQRSREPQPREQGASLSARTAASTVFVFRDGKRMTTDNYAIAGQTLWVFNEHAAKKYPLADLDRNATEQANSENGVDLHLPGATP